MAKPKFKVGDMVNIVSISKEYEPTRIQKKYIDIAIESKRVFEVVEKVESQTYQLKDFGFCLFEEELEFADIDDGGL